jgi:hypothetical protein
MIINPTELINPTNCWSSVRCYLRRTYLAVKHGSHINALAVSIDHLIVDGIEPWQRSKIFLLKELADISDLLLVDNV